MVPDLPNYNIINAIDIICSIASYVCIYESRLEAVV